MAPECAPRRERRERRRARPPLAAGALRRDLPGSGRGAAGGCGGDGGLRDRQRARAVGDRACTGVSSEGAAQRTLALPIHISYVPRMGHGRSTTAEMRLDPFGRSRRARRGLRPVRRGRPLHLAARVAASGRAGSRRTRTGASRFRRRSWRSGCREACGWTPSRRSRWCVRSTAIRPCIARRTPRSGGTSRCGSSQPSEYSLDRMRRRDTMVCGGPRGEASAEACCRAIWSVGCDEAEQPWKYGK